MTERLKMYSNYTFNLLEVWCAPCTFLYACRLDFYVWQMIEYKLTNTFVFDFRNDAGGNTADSELSNAMTTEEEKLFKRACSDIGEMEKVMIDEGQQMKKPHVFLLFFTMFSSIFLVFTLLILKKLRNKLDDRLNMV